MNQKIGIFFFCVLFFVPLFGASYPVNTQNSDFSSLKNDVCEFDEESDIVHCTKTGTFQKVVKDCAGTQAAKNQFIGSIVVDKKTCNLYAISPQQAIDQNKSVIVIAEKIAQQLFSPVILGTNKSSTPNPFPTTSLNSAAIDAAYGSSGLSMSSILIDYFKKFYFYFEYIVKVEYAARLAALAPNLGIDFVTSLEKTSWQDFVKAMIAKAGSWDNLEKKLLDASIQPQWDAVTTFIDAKTWQEVPQSSFWKSLSVVTAKSLTSSMFWQNYLKYTITRTFIQDSIILSSIKQLEESIFLYIPNIEIAYYHPDFVSLRNGSEMYHLSLLLTDAFRLRLLEHCNDWNTFKDPKTGSYDLVKLYAATKDYQATDFYKVAVLGEADAISTFKAIAQKKVPDQLKLMQTQPTLHDQICLMSMVKILHALTNYLYNKDHLDTTMQFFARINKNQSGPQPSMLLYSTEDYIFLDDLNHLNDTVEQDVIQKASQPKSTNPVDNAWNKLVKPSQGKVTTQSWSDFVDDITRTAGDVWSDIEKTGEDAYSALEKAGESLVETMISTEETIVGGIAKIPGLGEVLTGLSPREADKLLADAKKLRDQAVEDIKQAGKDLNQVVNDVIETATTAVKGVQVTATELVKDIGSGIDDVCNTLLASTDKELCKDISGAFVTTYQMLIDGLANLAHIAVYTYGGMMKLTADAVNLIARSATDLVVNNYGDLGDAITSGLKSMAIDAATTVLKQLTYTFKFFYDDLMNALKYAQYFISILTRLFIDASTAAAFVGAGIGWIFDRDINPFQVAEDAREKLSENERTINAAITTALLLATIPLTGGSSAWVVLPMIAMTVGPQIIQIVTAVQEDELKRQEKDEQHAFVLTFSGFIDTSKLVYAQQQREISNELQLKYTAELSNQERSVGFYENFMNKNFEAVKAQMSFLLENWWSQLLSPDSLGLSFADVGSVYGIKTGVYELNPSQGFSLYSAGRQSFSQEIAVMPETVSDTSDNNQLISSTNLSKNWFNQKETVPLASSVNEVEIRFKAIYLLNTFYIGIYIGGKVLDIAAITSKDKSKKANLDLDLDHLAKMAVFKREEITKPVVGCLYEHEGKGWFNETMPLQQFTVDTWYRINVQLQGTNLTMKLWPENNPNAAQTQTYPITALAQQKMIGVISSGAAIEYQIKKPAITVQAMPTIRPTKGICPTLSSDKPCLDDSNVISLSVEKTREQTARDQLGYKLNPTLGNFNPQAVSKDQILKNHFMYTSQATNLANAVSAQDYVAMCTIDSSLAVNGIGKYPLDNDSVISFISKKVFKNDGSFSGVRVTNAFSNFANTFPLPDSLVATVRTAEQAYTKQNMNVTFAPFTLKAVSQKAIENYQYIYTMPLVDNSGQPVKDDKKNALLDYLVFVVLRGTSLDTNYQPGLSYLDATEKSEKQFGLLSLVTGNLYQQGNKTPINKGYDIFSDFINSYQNPPLDKDLLAAMNAARTAYPQSGGAIIPLKPGGGTQTGGTSTSSGGNKGPDTGKGTDQQQITPPSQNMSDRTAQGAGDPSNISIG